jgi:protein KRI1
MSNKKKTLFDSDGDESGGEDSKSLKINEDYASRYDRWRREEEKQKLLARYGEVAVTKSDKRRRGAFDEPQPSDSDSTSEEEDDDAAFDTPEVDKGFLRALAALKSKDPKIYDPSVAFSVELKQNELAGKKAEKKKEKPMFLR